MNNEDTRSWLGGRNSSEERRERRNKCGTARVAKTVVDGAKGGSREKEQRESNVIGRTRSIALSDARVASVVRVFDVPFSPPKGSH